jgi:hypothetical protein
MTFHVIKVAFSKPLLIYILIRNNVGYYIYTETEICKECRVNVGWEMRGPKVNASDGERKRKELEEM